MPWRMSRAKAIRSSFWSAGDVCLVYASMCLFGAVKNVLFPIPSNRSRHSTSRVATVYLVSLQCPLRHSIVLKHQPFHSKLFCNLKNSLKAKSSTSTSNCFADLTDVVVEAVRLEGDCEDVDDEEERHI